MARYIVPHVEDEVIEGEVGGVIVRVTKRHIVQVPVEISADWHSRVFNVEADPEAVQVSCAIVADVVGLAPEKPKTTAPDLHHRLTGYPSFRGYRN